MARSPTAVSRSPPAGEPIAPASGPRLREQCRANRPFAADAKCCEKAEDQQLPPRLREIPRAGKNGVGQDCQHQRPAAAERIADSPEYPPADRPAKHERGLNPRA